MNLDCLTKERNIGSDEIFKLLKDKNVIFFIEQWDTQWVSKSEAFDFWKNEVEMRVVPLEIECIYLEDYPGEYCYVPIKYKNNKDENDLTCYIKLDMYH
ncbi:MULTISPECIES: hypothetical protein [Paraclostridium]|uniref:Uncharacterized protein n=2 Tax=Paraclostridium bifermentans TaxID=1490 RepID=A0AA44DMX6_PARBF|nr:MULTISPECIES: hypothetical protein [Paraclostridium]MBN8048969.1 hypothetical protein [Paraclostridium bifermentans]MBZ6006292.1 hypothetical protein [Paraclostridium bifermentans]MDU0297278.1 hypothetical protein [Paraclostridium sp. MRS3W1]NME10386.1 hypothetical protein [Paraclostridium bifermentans]